LAETFLAAKYGTAERYIRRLNKVEAIEAGNTKI
jgi:hypothetical protein